MFWDFTPIHVACAAPNGAAQCRRGRQGVETEIEDVFYYPLSEKSKENCK